MYSLVFDTLDFSRVRSAEADKKQKEEQWKNNKEKNNQESLVRELGLLVEMDLNPKKTEIDGKKNMRELRGGSQGRDRRTKRPGRESLEEIVVIFLSVCALIDELGDAQVLRNVI